MYRIGKSIKTESIDRQRLPGMWEWKVTANGHEVSFWGDRNVLKLDCYGVCTILYIHKTHQTAHLK